MRQTHPHSAADQALKEGLVLLLCEQGAFLSRLDWSSPEDVSLAEKRGRIIQVHRGNIEKTLGMTQHENQDQSHSNDSFGDDIDALRKEVERRLLRHADALGREELLRRLKDRGFTQDALELEFPGEARSEGTEG
ncbi:MAG: hypothetical protein AAF788_02460 [Pseudomonadota bacterium]